MGVTETQRRVGRIVAGFDHLRLPPPLIVAVAGRRQVRVRHARHLPQHLVPGVGGCPYERRNHTRRQGVQHRPGAGRRVVSGRGHVAQCVGHDLRIAPVVVEVSRVRPTTPAARLRHPHLRHIPLARRLCVGCLVVIEIARLPVARVRCVFQELLRRPVYNVDAACVGREVDHLLRAVQRSHRVAVSAHSRHVAVLHITLARHLVFVGRLLAARP